MLDRSGAEAVRFSDEHCAKASREVGRIIAERKVTAACGSLACGADILIAEAVVANHGELHVFLPFASDSFVDVSVRPGGLNWVERFERLLDAAASLVTLSDEHHNGDSAVFNECTHHAMEKTQEIGDEDVFQLAIWDGQTGPHVAGTAKDVEEWTSRGLESIIIKPQTLIDGV